MDYVNLGGTGLKVSRLCLGCMTYGSRAWRSWMLEEEEARPLIGRALDAGINFFDTADYYSLGASETILGRALKSRGVPRHEVVIATKVCQPMGHGPNQRGLSRKHILAAIDESLRRLGTDHVDLYQLHRFDPDTPMEETLGALAEIIRSGKVLHIGASTMAAWQFARLLGACEGPGAGRFVAMQSHYNLLYREAAREMLPLCRAQGVALLPWSPLARGRLAGGIGETPRSKADGKAARLYDHPSDAAILDRLSAVASRHAVSEAQIALAWLLHQPGVAAPIIGVTRPGHLDDAVKALALKLDAETIAELEASYRPHPVLAD